MEKKTRLQIFKNNLRKIAEEGKEGSFVIFETLLGKFVQFAGDREMGLICDIPARAI